MEYKTILSGLFERLSGFRQKRPYAGQKYELMGITAELIDVICQLRDDVLRRFSQEAVIDLDLDVDYGQLAEQALQAELPDGLEGWDSKMSEDLTHTEIVSRLEGDLSESFPQMITQMDNLRLQQLAMVTNETLGELNSVLLKIADAKVRPHRDEEYYIHGNALLSRIKISHKGKAHSFVFFGYSYFTCFYRIAIKFNAVLFAFYLTNLLEHPLDILSIAANAPRHEVNVQSRTGLEPIVGIKQRAAFQDKPILVFANGKPVQQAFLEITR